MEEEIITTEINVAEIILETINSLCQSLFSSIDKTILPLLDSLTFIDSGITKSNHWERIMGTKADMGLLVLANSLLVAFVLYYAIRRLTAYFSGQEVESPYRFVIRAIFIAILMNFSLTICAGIVDFSYEISNFICELGKNILHKEISLSSFISILNDSSNSNFNLFSMDGILATLLSFSSFGLMLHFSVRYILTKLLILLSPFAFLCLLNKTTMGFFRSWLKSFLSLLFIQIIVAFLLLIPFAIMQETSSMFNKILLIGSIYALLKSNQFIKEFINGTGISTDFNSSLSRYQEFICKISFHLKLLKIDFSVCNLQK